jgi:ribosomal protein S18 acetylase RimI-like enzyme
MSATELPLWLERTHATYEQERIAAGESPAAARANADRSREQTFPDGRLKPGHAVFHVIARGAGSIGYLWIGPDTSDDAGAWWVWDIEVSDAHRGRGYGRAAMLLGEHHARAQGATTLGLNVFGFNTTARGLYESLGYQATAIQMKKTL